MNTVTLRMKSFVTVLTLPATVLRVPLNIVSQATEPRTVHCSSPALESSLTILV